LLPALVWESLQGDKLLVQSMRIWVLQMVLQATCAPTLSQAEHSLSISVQD
jgi:hypothetical protein